MKAAAETRLDHFDGVRGLAALQVVAQHYVMAFLPGIALADPGVFHAAWEAVLVATPLRFLFDGTFAVCLFFLLSGAVITLSFGRTPRDVTGNALRRVTRLWVPAAAACVLAFVLTQALPHAHDDAAALSFSHDWLGGSGPDTTILALLRETFIDGMIVGTSDNTLFPALGGWLRPLGTLLDPPVWSLHIELYGSLLVLLLVWIESVSARLYRLVAVGACVLLLPHPIVLMVVGHLTAPLLRPGADRRHPRLSLVGSAAAPLLAAGALLAAMPPVAWLTRLDFWLTHSAVIGLPHMYQAFTTQRMLGAMLVYAAVVAGGRARSIFGGSCLRRLGQLSFSLYLVHFPVLFTLTSLGFTLLSPHFPYGFGLLVTVVGGLVVTFALAALFERWVDRPAMVLSRKVAHSVARIRLGVRIRPAEALS